MPEHDGNETGISGTVTAGLPQSLNAGMSGHDIEDLAKGLNSSERWIIQHMTDEPKPYVSVRGQPRVSLFRKGLLTCAIERPVPMMALTTMGLAVRTYLHRNPTPKGLSS